LCFFDNTPSPSYGGREGEGEGVLQKEGRKSVRKGKERNKKKKKNNLNTLKLTFRSCSCYASLLPFLYSMSFP